MSDSNFQVGTRARVIVNGLGSVRADGPRHKFVEFGVFNFGTEGEIVEAHAEAGWWYLRPDSDPELLIPIEPGMMVAI